MSAILAATAPYQEQKQNQRRKPGDMGLVSMYLAAAAAGGLCGVVVLVIASITA